MPDTFSDLPGQPLQLSDGPQLLIDEALIEDRFSLQRVMYKPLKYERNPILLRDQPWEGSAAYRPMVVYDDQVGMYRMWYQVADMNAYHGGGHQTPYYVGYAESHDGFSWSKPLLENKPFGDHEKTNIVYTGHMTDSSGKRHFSLGQAFIDKDADPAERYKMVGLDAWQHPRHTEVINTEVSIVGSSDGYNWKRLGEAPIFDHHSDTGNHIVYDPHRKRWLLYCRPSVFASGRQFGDGRHQRRRTSVMVSDDLKNWSYPRIVLFGDERDLIDIDHCRVFRYGSHFLMLYAAVDGDVGRFYTKLASSYDGIRWNRFHTREVYVPMGAEGQWDGGIIGPSSGPVPHGDQLLFYYLGANIGQGETYQARTYRRMGGGIFMTQRDRFVAQRAEGTGWLITRPFVLEGASLSINALTAGGLGITPGCVRAEVVQHPKLGYHADAHFASGGRDHYAVDGFNFDDCQPFTGDRMDATVRWKNGDLASLVGQPIQLRFEITNADLFSFKVTT